VLVVRTKDTKMQNLQKLPPIVEDLRQHTPEQLLELRLMLTSGIKGREDARRPGFYEMDGVSNVYYVFRYPSGHKILLVAAWDRQTDPVADLVAYACPAA
jgi:hypothetical protein